MKMIDKSPICYKDSYSLTEAINKNLIRVNEPKFVEAFERLFKIRPQLMLEASEAFSKNEADVYSYDVHDVRSKLFEEIFPSFFVAQEDVENLDVSIRVDSEYFVTYSIRGSVLEIVVSRNDASDLLIDTTLEAFTAYVRHKLYHAATLVNQGKSEEEVFSKPIGLIELSGEQMEMVAGGTIGCGWACAMDLSGCDDTIGLGPDPTDDSSCTGNACYSQSGGPCTADACAADVCDNNACAGDAGGTTACKADACYADVCAGDACGANACAGDACGADACGGNACAADTCWGDFCGANVCGVQACGIDFIPGIPGI